MAIFESSFYFVTDLAVGAPHVNDGKGAVYIYRGTKKGLSEEVAQVRKVFFIHSERFEYPKT